MKYFTRLAGLLGLATLSLLGSTFGFPVDAPLGCRCLPGDACWPSTAAWDSFNETIDGRLIANVPIGSVCHDPTYDEGACAALQESWTLGETHYLTSSSVMQIFFANQSCDPFTDRESPCGIGNYPLYSVNVSEVEHVQETLRFVKENNIRLTVRNTGHDFLGRSNGAGSVALWTHNLKERAVIQDYSSSIYDGPALRMQSGTQGGEALDTATQNGYIILTGSCSSVGLAGGYTQGGGHSIVASSFGLGSDQALEFEVITANGELVVASPDENEDLFWALSGGGSGNYGVVWSYTARLHQNAEVGGSSIIVRSDGITREVYQQVIESFHELLTDMVDFGATVHYIVDGSALTISPLTLLGSTGEFVRDTVAGPFLARLAELGVTHESRFTTLDYREHYRIYLQVSGGGTVDSTSDWQFGGRLIPRDSFDPAVFSSVVGELIDEGILFVGTAANYNPPHEISNGVNPAWRTALINLMLLSRWNHNPDAWANNLEDQELMTSEYVPRVKAISPDSGAYMNEADFREPLWKEEWFGASWDRLSEVKETWDPEGVLYVFKGVGSEAWDLENDGRLCRVAS